MAILGLRDTSGFTTTGQRPENWRETLMLLHPNSAEAAKAPLTALTSLMKTRSLNDPHFHWFTKELDDRRLKVDAPILIGTTSIPVDETFKSSFIVHENTVLYVEQTGELMLVVADPTAVDSITVVRGFGGSTAMALDTTVAGTNPNLLIIGTAFEEGSLAPTGVNFDPEEVFNYLQIFRRTLEITRTASKTRLRTGDAVKEARRECLEMISVDMERAFILGRRSIQTYKGKPQRTTGGIIWQIEQAAPENIITLPGGNMDLDTFEAHMQNMFRYGSSEKMMFGGNGALGALQRMVRKNSDYSIAQGEKEYGMRVTRFVTPFGELVFKAHPLFTQNAGGTTAGTKYYGMNHWGLILDMDQLKYCHLDDSDLDYQTKLEENGLDGMKSGYLAECGIEIGHAKTCFLIKNMVTGMADAA